MLFIRWLEYHRVTARPARLRLVEEYGMGRLRHYPCADTVHPCRRRLGGGMRSVLLTLVGAVAGIEERSFGTFAAHEVVYSRILLPVWRTYPHEWDVAYL